MRSALEGRLPPLPPDFRNGRGFMPPRGPDFLRFLEGDTCSSSSSTSWNSSLWVAERSSSG